MIGIILITVSRLVIIEPSLVNGFSMEPTLTDNEMVFVNKLPLLFRAPKRGDIVQFWDEHSGEYVIKRVVAIPGESVSISNNQVILVDRRNVQTVHEEPYLQDSTITRNIIKGELTHSGRFIKLNDHEYFMLGDNREQSIDSRHYGSIHRVDITGIVHPLKTITNLVKSLFWSPHYHNSCAN